MAVKTFTAGADLTGKFGYAVVASATNKVVTLPANANDICLGILMNDNTSGKVVGVALPGEVCKVKLGGAVDFGAELKTAAGGALVAAGGTGDDKVIAKALEDGASGDLIYAVVENFIK